MIGGTSRSKFVLALPVVMLFLMVASASCDPCSPYEPCLRYHDVTYSNETAEDLVVKVSDGRGAKFWVLAGEELEMKFGLWDSRGDQRWNDKDDPVSISVYDADGCSVLSVTRSLREIQDDHSTVTIRPGELRVADRRFDCDPKRVKVGLENS